jgi:hypothetical protein
MEPEKNAKTCQIARTKLFVVALIPQAMQASHRDAGLHQTQTTESEPCLSCQVLRAVNAVNAVHAVIGRRLSRPRCASDTSASSVDPLARCL